MAYLSNISYSLGERFDISELNEDPEMLKILKLRGLSEYSKVSSNLVELTLDVLKQIKGKISDSNKVGYFIYVFDKMNALEECQYNPNTVLNEFLDYLEIPNAVPFIVSILACASTSLALKIASNLVDVNLTEEVVIVYCNKIPESDKRVLSPPTSVLSDAGLAMSVTKENRYRGFEIISCNHFNNSALKDYKNDEEYGFFLEHQIKECKNIFNHSLDSSHLGSHVLKRVYFNNYMPHLVKMFYLELSVESDQQFLKNIPIFSHAYSADTFINLADDLQNLSYGDFVCLLPNSFTSWGGIILKYLGGILK